jgi:hypothetical protein
MDYILITASVASLCIATFLWLTVKIKMVGLTLEASLVPEKGIRSAAHASLIVWYRRAFAFFTIRRVLVLIGLILGVAGIALSRIVPHATLILTSTSIAGWMLALSPGFAFRLLMERDRTYRSLSQMRRLKEIVFERKWDHSAILERTEYVGWTAVPKKVYVGDTHNLTVRLSPAIRTESGELIQLTDPNSDSDFLKYFSLTVGTHIGTVGAQSGKHLETELLAAAVTIDGEKKQRQSLDSPNLQFSWNCFFENSGNHSINLILRLIDGSNTVDIGSIQHSIKVVKLDGLTQRQVWFCVSLSGVLSGGFAIAEALRRLNFW